jgi:branched-chain amino acid transport system ATP-binding protein
LKPLLELRDVNAGYDAMRVLFSVDLSVPAGQIVALLGPNGAGKTTTLRVASGILSPSSSKGIWFDGSDISRLKPRDRARLGICMIPEGRGIFPNLTVRENLLLHLYAAHNTSRDDVESIAYDRFPVLGKRRKQIAGTMSGGEQQMLALSRALTTKPRLLLLDELSMGLAPRLVEELFATVKGEVIQRGVTVLMVEQLAVFAVAVADTVAVMSRGNITAVGSPKEVKNALDDAYLGRSQSAGSTPKGPAEDLGRSVPAERA